MDRVSLPTESSWGESVRAYDAARRKMKTTPWQPHITHLSKRSTFNPLLSRHSDEENELKLRDREAAQVATRLAMSQRKETKPLPKRRPPPRARNILVQKPVTTVPLKKRSDFDIISNKFAEDHDGHVHRERTLCKNTAQKKLWKRDYDPIRGVYYDHSKETEYHRQRKVIASCAGLASKARLPPAVQYSEGSAYDIVSNQVKDATKLKGPCIKRVYSEKSDKEEVPRNPLARFAKTVHLKERDLGRTRGYDVITGIGVHGLHSKPLAPLPFDKPPTAFETLQRSALTL